MRAVRDQHFITALAPAAVVGLDHAQTRPLAMRAGGRLQAHAIHRGEHQQRPLQLPHQAQRALGARRRMVGVKVSEVLETGQRLVDRRVVLHGAGAQRIETLVQVEVEPSQPAEVARHFRLTQ